jgi:hypothetical protein
MPNPEHAVLVRIKLTDDQFGAPAERNAIHELADRLRDAIARAGVGEYDGDEFGGGQCTFYMYGPDADRLFGAIEPSLRTFKFAPGSTATRRFGGPQDPGVRSEVIQL